MQPTLLLFLACMLLSGCSPRQTPSTSSKDEVPRGESFAFLDGTTMRVREHTGESLRGIHIVRKTPHGDLETTDAETGRISEGTDRQVMRIILYDAHVDLGPKGQFTVEQLTMDLTKPLDAASLEKIARDLRQQRLTKKMQRTGR